MKTYQIYGYTNADLEEFGEEMTTKNHYASINGTAERRAKAVEDARYITTENFQTSNEMPDPIILVVIEDPAGHEVHREDRRP